MTTLIRIITYTLVALLPMGELLRFPWIHATSLRILDILVVLLLFCVFIFRKKDYQKALQKNWYFLFFSAILIVSHVWSIHNSTLPSVLYLGRTLLYFQIPLLLDSVKGIINLCKVTTLLLIGSGILVISALFQYLFYPALANLYYLGYDVHYYRAVGLLVDPNLLGIVLVFVILYCLYTYKSPARLVLVITALVVLALTFSRISIICLFIGVLVIFLKKRVSYTALLFCAAIVGLMLLFIPRQLGEGNKLLRTNSIVAKSEAWQKGLQLWQKTPLLGIGFNNSQLYKPTVRPFAASIEIPDNSYYGLDSTILTLLVTTGIIGILAYLLLFGRLLRINDSLKVALTLIYFVHSFSTNSFFTPTVFLYFMVLYHITEQK